MLLFGLLLLSTVLAAAQDLDDNVVIKACMNRSTLKSLELQVDDEPQKLGCSAVGTEDFRFNSEFFTIDLWGKGIQNLEKGWYRLNSYSSSVGLILNINNIERLRNGIIDSRNLIMLDLSSNLISEIESGALTKSERLKSLYLQDNRLTDTEFAATLPPSLEKLSLRSNAITAISPNSFSNLGELKMLNLDNNRITMIQQHAFHGLQNVRMVYLSFNPIEKVEKGSFISTPLLDEIITDQWGYRSLADLDDILPSLTNKTFIINHREPSSQLY